MKINRKPRRLVIVAPMRSHTETVRAIFELKYEVETYLETHFGNKLKILAMMKKTFGLVSGTGTGKTFFLKLIARILFGDNFSFDVVTREEESSQRTWTCDVLVVTTGIAMHYLNAGIIDSRDCMIIDEVHQTSSHMELAMALARYKNVPVSWMSATINPAVYRQYFETDEILTCANVDPDKRAVVECNLYQWGYAPSWDAPKGVTFTKAPFAEDWLLLRGGLNKIIDGKHRAVVFLPTRALCEQLAEKCKRTGLHTDFYHGGESAAKLRPYLSGTVQSPFVVFMTSAGASSLNIEGLDFVVIQNQTYREKIYNGVKKLERTALTSNQLLQMGGRVDGRMAGSQIIILSEFDPAYSNLRPETPEFVLSGDPEDVAIICARQKIDLTDLKPIGHIDREQFQKVRQMLIQREILEENGMLSEYGKEVSELPVSRAWAEMIVEAQYDDNAETLVPMMVICSASSSLHGILNRQGNHDIKKFVVEGNDFLTVYNIIIEVMLTKGFCRIVRDRDTGQPTWTVTRDFYSWATEKGLYGKSIKESLIAIASVCRAMGINIASAEFPDITDELDHLFRQKLAEIGSLISLNSYNSTLEGYSCKMGKTSSCQESAPKIGRITVLKNTRGDMRIFEGAVINFEDLQAAGVLSEREVVHVHFGFARNYDEIIVDLKYAGLGFDQLITHQASYAELPEDLLEDWKVEAEKEFADAMTGYMSPFREDNERIFARVKSARGLIGIVNYELQLEAKQILEKRLAKAEVHTMTMARAKGVELRLKLDDFLTQEEMRASISGRDISRVQARPQPSGLASFADILLERIQPGLTEVTERATRLKDVTVNGREVRGIDLFGHAEFSTDRTRVTGKTYKKRRAEVCQTDKNASKVEPKGMTQERITWLEQKAEPLQKQLTVADQAITEANAKLSQAEIAAYANQRDKKLQEIWGDAGRALTAAQDAKQKLVQNLRPMIDLFETEILEIMEELGI